VIPFCGPNLPEFHKLDSALCQLSSKSFRVNLSFSGSVVLKKIYKRSHPTFGSISPFRRTRPFIWIDLNSLCPRMICIKFDWNWPAGPGNFILKFSVNLLFCYYLPLENIHHLNKPAFPPHGMIYARFG
jgi:hypothetical protein